MSKEDLRRLAEEHWTALVSRPTTGERRLRVAQLPIMTDQGAVAAAVDHEGYRHLLVPIDSHRKIRSELTGPVLQLRKRPLEDEDTYQMFADLTCLRKDVNDLFTRLCADVLSTVEALPEDPVKALYRVLDRWKSLFQAQTPTLGPEQLLGLFAELLVLSELLHRDPSAHRLWLGPRGHRHDFSTGAVAIEVKAGADGKARKPRIHGLTQLEAPADGLLHLAWFSLNRLTTSDVGTGFVDLVERVLHLCDDEGAVTGLLAEVGYSPLEDHRYRDVRFAVTEEKWYQVGPGFPGLTSSALAAAGLPVSVEDVEYTVDLSGDSPFALGRDDVPNVLDRIIRESA
ncbi:PD-(D/E)XK motif protein [Streptomyces luteogriseus]|uniref:PD-(D/E)XK motif protein n=1 Tax=Streptomyces luteogriseus TaxID=68233 RepID=UPI002E3637C6|nr:PD-(D/E)XK motif protein [Streptomyces luteogriseus]WTJ30271.1 PD-(D/E)XK motif protein [Streptomyces luteogriseus]